MKQKDIAEERKCLFKQSANIFEEILEYSVPLDLGLDSTDPNAGSYSMSTKLRASKSMQNLEQLTRDSFYNLKDISNNLKQRYNSRMELRQQSQMYNELWDSEDDDGSETDQDYYHRSHRSYDY